MTVDSPVRARLSFAPFRSRDQCAFTSVVLTRVSPFRSPKAGQGNKCVFFCILRLISFCIVLYFEFYFHIFNVASFDELCIKVISVIFAFILVLRLPFVVSKVNQP